MTGLLAGPLTDAVGLDAVRADLASVVPQVLGPAPRFAVDQPMRRRVPTVVFDDAASR